jgi:hypothetical protein
MTDYRSRLLTPPREEEDISPYRPVWRSILVENAAYAGVTAVTFVLFGLLGIGVPDLLRQPLNIALAALPTGLWVLFSLFPERFALRPRRQLLAVFLFSALIARAIGQPLIEDFFRTDEWLPLESALNRIVGYTFTVGIVQAALCYLVVRTFTGASDLRDRYDALAYAMAAALGYALIPSLEFALDGSPNPYVVAADTFSRVGTLVVSSMLIAYGLAATRFDGAPAFFMPFVLAVASLLAGLSIPLYVGFLNASFSLGGVSVQRHILGIGFTVGFILAGLFLSYILFSNSERQAREQDR